MLNFKSQRTTGIGLLFLLLLAVADGLPGTAHGQTPTHPSSITVVLDDNYPPYIFRDVDSHVKGILPDQWSLWEQKTGVKVNLQAMDWANAQQFMKDGHADVIDTIFLTEGRRYVYDFTPPYAQIEVPVFAHKDLGGITDVSSLQGFTVGVKAGDAVIEKLAAQGITSVKEYPNYEAIIQAAKNQEIKVFSVDQPAAIYYLYKYNIADQFRQSFVIYTGAFHRAVAKNKPELLNLVQGGFEKISPREYRAIEQKWMGTPFLLQHALREWAPWLMLVATVILMLTIISIVLRRQVHVRTAELRQALADLQQSQNRIQSILRLAPVGIGVLVRREIREVNDTLCEISGYPRNEMIGQSTRLFYVSEEEYDRVGHVFYEQIVRDGIGSIEIHGKKKNGELVHWILCGARLDAAKPDNTIIFTTLDITERKKSEVALLNSREYFATVFNSINDALLIHDSQTGHLLDVNQRTCEMSGYTREEMLALGLGPMCAGSSPYSLKEISEWNQKARTEGPQVVEFLARHRDGHTFWVEASLRHVQIGTDDRLIVTVRDITERKSTEEERFNLERRVQETQKLESLGLLAGGIAHDFNNLLAAILGNIELAQLNIPKNSTAHEDIQSAVAATKRAADLVQQMLAYSGKGRFLVESVDVTAIIRETVHMIQTSLSKNARLNFRFPVSLPHIEADSTQVRQVIMNLVINASEALENRSGTIDISAGVMDGKDLSPTHVWPHDSLPLGPYVYVEVADTGVGIRPEALDKIFDPFFSTKFVGRGLGLAAVLGIVRSHKGAIQVDSIPGKGTTFRVLFPITPPPPSAKTQPTPGAAQTGRIGSGRLLLLVDDDQDLRETATKLLTHLGFQVLCAIDGQQAIHLFRAQAPHIAGVILDLTMPNLDGVQTLTELRRIRSDIPVVVSSGHGEQEIAQRFAGLNLNGFIQKPYTLEGLRNALGHLLPPQSSSP